VAGRERRRVIGYSDTSGSAAANRFTALKRARAVAAMLQAAGISAAASANYPAPDQYRQEREFGEASFRRVEIVPGSK
jgi:outer membrane protein OmpA-like peptidoglycan-associated protein